MRASGRRRTTAVLSVTAFALTPIVAGAAGFQLLEQSASRLGTAFAGSAAAADDATTIFFNPAGLTELERPEATAVFSAIEITSEFVNRNSQAALGQPLGSDGGDAGDWNFVPSAYVALPISDALAVGFGFNVPFGLKLEYPNDWMGRFQALNSEIQTMNFNPAIAWQVNEAVSVAFGLNYQRIQAELTNAVNYTAVIAGQVPPASVPATVAANPGLEGVASVRGDDTAWGFNAGVLFKLSEATRIGLAYRSKIEYEVSGWATFNPPTAPTPTGALIIGGASAAGGPLASGPASVDLELPDIATLSFAQRFGDRFELLADVGWTGWSSIQELRVVRDTGATLSVTPERWDDTFRISLGGAFELSDALTLRAGLGFDETPVPDQTRTPRLPDPDRTWAAVGASWSPSEAIQIDVGYAHLFSDEVPLNHTSETGVLATGRLVGVQESDVDILSTQIVWRF